MCPLACKLHRDVMSPRTPEKTLEERKALQIPPVPLRRAGSEWSAEACRVARHHRASSWQQGLGFGVWGVTFEKCRLRPGRWHPSEILNPEPSQISNRPKPIQTTSNPQATVESNSALPLEFVENFEARGTAPVITLIQRASSIAATPLISTHHVPVLRNSYYEKEPYMVHHVRLV